MQHLRVRLLHKVKRQYTDASKQILAARERPCGARRRANESAPARRAAGRSRPRQRATWRPERRAEEPGDGGKVVRARCRRVSGCAREIFAAGANDPPPPSSGCRVGRPNGGLAVPTNAAGRRARRGTASFAFALSLVGPGGRRASSDRRNGRSRPAARGTRPERSASGEPSPSQSSPPLEVEVLERLGRPAIKPRCAAVVAPTPREIALGDPRCGTVACRGQLVEARFGGGEEL